MADTSIQKGTRGHTEVTTAHQHTLQAYTTCTASYLHIAQLLAAHAYSSSSPEAAYTTLHKLTAGSLSSLLRALTPIYIEAWLRS